MKNGVVLELYKNHVAVLTPEGEFLKVRKDPQLCYIGEEIWFRESDIEVPGVINKLKKRYATPKFLFQTAALATGLLLFFTSGLNTYMANALSSEGFLASAFDFKSDGNGEEDTNQASFSSSELAAKSNSSDEDKDETKSSISQIIGESPAVAYNNEQQQFLDSNPTANQVEFNQNSLSDFTSNDLTTAFIDTPGMNSTLDTGYFTVNFGNSNVTFPVNTEIADMPTIGDLAGIGNIASVGNTVNIGNVVNNSSSKKIKDDSTSHSLITDKGFVAIANDNESSSSKLETSIKPEAPTLTEPETSTNSDVSTSTKPGTSVNPELPNVETPVNNHDVGNNSSDNNITLPNTPNNGSNSTPSKDSGQDNADTSGLAPEYVAGLETGKDKDKNDTNSNQETNKEDEDTSTSTDNDNSGSGNTDNSSSESNPNVDMSATCEKDGYYYENERILTFEKDENGKVVEVYKDVPIKKYCDNSQQNSNNNSATTEEPAPTPSESETQTGTENNESVETETPTETETPAETETQPNTDAPVESPSEEVPPTESLTFG
ncbi:anti-sigma factor domain-containing protein [Priestia megaterium]|uniref:Anti-sigma factor domain-containing protein n=1 Tax=Priestia megaterium TaxID=1404 RepID=A0A6M6E307_PRIMG|nr:anti-sigma factor domain-containing protein [Priestia megaterium]QJX80044.1 anti-sigma factor domain-containing protein [Priestia megaterium]